MFCSNCGKNLVDGAKFCDACGVSTTVSEISVVTVATSQSNPIFKDFLMVIRGFFSKNTVKTIGESAKSTGKEWCLLATITVLIYAFALPININQIFDSVLGSLSGMLSGMLGSALLWLLFGLIISIGTYFLMSFLIFGTMKLIFKKNVNLNAVLNLVATASFPLAMAYVLNIILGFIWVPFIFIFSATAMISSAVLLYVGVQKLEKLESSPFVAYTGIWAIAIAIVVIIVSVVINSVIENAVGSVMGSAMNVLGGLLG